MHWNRSRGTLMSYGDHSAQLCFKSNTPIYDSWSGCLWRDTRDSQWERASVTYRMLRASIDETWQPQTCHESREHHPYSFLYFVFHCETERAPGEPADNVDCPSDFFSSHVWSRECPWDLVSLWNRSYNHQVCGLVVWSNHVCVQRIIRLKIVWNVFMSVVSHGFKIV